MTNAGPEPPQRLGESTRTDVAAEKQHAAAIPDHKPTPRPHSYLLSNLLIIHRFLIARTRTHATTIVYIELCLGLSRINDEGIDVILHLMEPRLASRTRNRAGGYR